MLGESLPVIGTLPCQNDIVYITEITVPEIRATIRLRSAPVPAHILTGDVLAQKRELPVHAVKASPQVRQTGLNRPQPSVEAVQAGGKVPAQLQAFLANM